MQAQQISTSTQIHSQPQFNDDIPAEAQESSTLEIGQECLNFFDGDAQKAIEKFEIHKIEIILTNLHNLLSTQKNPQDTVFKQVLEFIKTEDGA